MKNALSHRALVMGFALLSILWTPLASAASKNSAVTVPVANASDTSTGTSTPSAPATPPPPPPPPPVANVVDTYTAGDLVATDASIKAKRDYVDVFLNIKNTGKYDETIIGADTPLENGGVALVKKDKDGKETETPFPLPLPAGKTVELSDSSMWIRIKNLKNELKDTDVMPFEMYSRRSPNILLKIAVNPKAAGNKSGSGVLDWLKK